MIKYLFTFLIILIPFGGFSQDNKDFELFLKILGKVESNNNDQAIGDNSKALGRFQIWESYFNDAKEFDKSLNKYKYSDVTNKIVSEKVVRAYMNRYCKNGTMEQMAKCHNGGCGWKTKKGKAKENLDKYWKKFEIMCNIK